MGEDTTPEKATELALDEAGQPDPVDARGGRGEEGLQVLPDHSVQDRVGGSARPYRLGTVRHVLTYSALVVTMSSCQRR